MRRLYNPSLSQPVSSDQGELIKECFSIDVFTLKDPRVSFVQPLLQPASSGRIDHSMCFGLMYLPLLCFRGVTRCVRECPC